MNIKKETLSTIPNLLNLLTMYVLLILSVRQSSRALIKNKQP